MSKPVRIISIVLALILVIGAVTGVAFWTASVDPDEVTPGLMIDGKLVEQPGDMLKVGNHSISFDEYRYYFMMTKAYMESSGGATMWDDDVDHAYAMQLKQGTEEGIRQMYAWVELAAEMGVALEDADREQIVTTLEQQKISLGANFGKNLKSMFFTSEEMYIRITEMQVLQQKVQTAIRDENVAQAEKDALASVISAQHILIQPAESLVVPSDTAATSAASAVSDASVADASASVPADELGLEVVEEDSSAVSAEDAAALDAQAKAVADEIVRLIRASEDPLATFAQMRADYDTDGGQPEEGYTFGEGEMVDEFYQGALALQVGEISDPVKTSYGYHIILRQEVPQTYLDENLETLINNKLTTIANEKITAIMEDMLVVPSDNYQFVSPFTMK